MDDLPNTRGTCESRPVTENILRKFWIFWGYSFRTKGDIPDVDGIKALVRLSQTRYLRQPLRRDGRARHSFFEFIVAISGGFVAPFFPELTLSASLNKGARHMSTITTSDGTEIYYKDWGVGPVVTFSHGWPLSADAWDGQLQFLADNGYRAVAHDRRGHGRSSQPSNGNDMDTYADDLGGVDRGVDSGMPPWSAIPRGVGRWRVTSVAMARAESPKPPWFQPYHRS